MNGGYKLTGREKVLLWLVGIVMAVFFTVYFLIIPAITLRDETEAQLQASKEMYDVASQQFMQAEVIRSQVEAVQILIDRATERLKGYDNRFRVFTETEDLEGEFTLMMLEKGIAPESFTMSSENYRGLGGVQKESDLVKFQIIIEGTGMLKDLLLLPDYVNDVFSYRLTEMEITVGEEDEEDGGISIIGSTQYQAQYTIEALLRGWE